MPSFNQLQRGVCLALFTIAGAYSLYNPHVFKTAALTLIGVICYDLVCFFRDKTKVKNYGSEIKELSEKLAATTQHVKELKDDSGINKMANTFRR